MTSTDFGSEGKTRCIVIGAGVSGIALAKKLDETFGSTLSFRIFERNHDLGGTWLVNQYPGAACDVPSHVYQYSFCLNPEWSQFFSSSSEIQTYLKRVTQYYVLEKYISYSSEVIHAQWNESKSIWMVEVRGQGVYECEILINAGGIFNNPLIPEIRNLDKFQGRVLHTTAYDTKVNLKGKRIAIIGGGATTVQAVPALQPEAGHIDVYLRTPTWICPAWGSEESNLDGTDVNRPYTAAEKQKLRDDPNYYLNLRKVMDHGFNSMYKGFFKDSQEQRDLRTKLETRMRQQIKSPELQKRLIPNFEVYCRRMNPGEPYLHALQKPNVTPIFDPIHEVTSEGILTSVDSSQTTERKYDCIILATGFNTTFIPRFPIIGISGTNLQDLWADNPASYLSVGVSGFPNYLTFLGPNTPISNGSLMPVLEATADYCVRMVSKFVSEHVKTFNVLPKAQADFDAFTCELMKGMAWSGTCRSWFKNPKTGKVTAIWPGSSLHYVEVMSRCRFEDYEWVYEGNMFDYWDKGFSKWELEGGDLTFYHSVQPNLPLEQVDILGSIEQQEEGHAELQDMQEVEVALDHGPVSMTQTANDETLIPFTALSDLPKNKSAAVWMTAAVSA